LARPVSSGTITVIAVPGTSLLGSARNWMNVLASQVSTEPVIAGVKWKPDSDPAFRPATPASEGPMPFTPGWLEWQAEHCA